MAEADIRRTISAVERTAERVIKRIGFSVHGKLVTSTPVDTGWARANWVVSIGAPFQGVAGSPGAVTTGPQADGTARLLVYSLTQSPLIWITNNVPYIRKLNEGHSKQAPANFVERAIDQGVAAVVR